MGRKRSVELPDKDEPSRNLTNYEFEKRKWDAYNELRGGVSYRKAAANHNISYRCLFDYARGKKNRVESHEQYMALPMNLERELASNVARIAEQSGSQFPSQKTIIQLANDLIQQNISNVAASAAPSEVQKSTVSDTWVSKFLRRHPELSYEKKSKRRKLESSLLGNDQYPLSAAETNNDNAILYDEAPQMQTSLPPSTSAISTVTSAYTPISNPTTKQALIQWFGDLNKLIDKFHVRPGDIYNMDFAGFQLGEATGCRFINHQVAAAQPKIKNRETFTAIECVCTDGSFLEPMILLPEESASDVLIPITVVTTRKGLPDQASLFNWLRNLFDTQTQGKAGTNWRMLIMKGNATCLDLLFLLWAWEHRILVMILPPATSHITQPLDLGVFGPLKQGLIETAKQYFQTQRAAQQHQQQQQQSLSSASTASPRPIYLGLPQFWQIYSQVRIPALSRENIVNAWSHAGIVPRNPNKVLDRGGSMAAAAAAAAEVVTTDSSLGGPSSSVGEYLIDEELVDALHASGAFEEGEGETLEEYKTQSQPIRSGDEGVFALFQAQISQSINNQQYGEQTQSYIGENEPEGANNLGNGLETVLHTNNNDGNNNNNKNTTKSQQQNKSVLHGFNQLLELGQSVFNSPSLGSSDKPKLLYSLLEKSYELLIQKEIELVSIRGGGNSIKNKAKADKGILSRNGNNNNNGGNAGLVMIESMNNYLKKGIHPPGHIFTNRFFSSMES